MKFKVGDEVEAKYKNEAIRTPRKGSVVRIASRSFPPIYEVKDSRGSLRWYFEDEMRKAK